MEIVEYTNEINTLYYRCTFKNGYVYQDWYGEFLTLEEVVKGSMCGLNMCKEKGVNLMLNNNSNLQGSWDHANEWIAGVWLPQAIGLKLKLAHVVSDEVYASLSADQWKENVDSQIKLCFFNNYDAAENWLLSNN